MRKIYIISSACIALLFFGCNEQALKKVLPESKQAEQTINNQENDLDYYNNCPLEGNAKRKDIKELNRLKNRYNFPKESDFVKNITLKSLLKDGEDSERWTPGQAVEIVGYVSEVVKGGVETCNCKATDDDNRDTHIEITDDPMASEFKNPLIAEVTPRFRFIMAKKGIDWSTKTLRKNFKGRWVKIQGWLFYDTEHADEADNTKPGRERNWRKTAWEIHPITSIEIVQRPR